MKNILCLSGNFTEDVHCLIKFGEMSIKGVGISSHRFELWDTTEIVNNDNIFSQYKKTEAIAEKTLNFNILKFSDQLHLLDY